MGYGEKQELKRAVWQFLIDHSTTMADGAFRITFYVKNYDHLWKRVKARQTGAFKRYDLEEKEAVALSREKIYQAHWVAQKINAQRSKRLQEAKNGHLVDRLIAWLYGRTRDYLFGKINTYEQSIPPKKSKDGPTPPQKDRIIKEVCVPR